MKHLILGAGPAGVIAAETLRKHAPDDDITILGDEPEAPYSRMAIPYLLLDEIGEPGTHLRHDPDHYGKLRITLQRGRAAKVDTGACTVALEDGGTLPYDRLLIATGSSPATPPIPGIDGPGVHPCWTLADAREIMKLAQPGARVLQMGAGFIGCIIMEALAGRGVRLSGHTRPYAVLGHPIGHTLSPMMHNASFAALGLDAVYLAFDVAPERLLGVLLHQ
jgi:NADPH-dependent 2,4-dienoyl-CoA reductase/sulfur reductase-like enzyme